MASIRTRRRFVGNRNWMAVRRHNRGPYSQCGFIASSCRAGRSFLLFRHSRSRWRGSMRGTSLGDSPQPGTSHWTSSLAFQHREIPDPLSSHDPTGNTQPEGDFEAQRPPHPPCLASRYEPCLRLQRPAASNLKLYVLRGAYVLLLRRFFAAPTHTPCVAGTTQ
jgi:hypothetical protein